MLGALGQFALGQLPSIYVFPAIIQYDVFDSGRKKRKEYDLIAEEVRRKEQLRRDLELAVYGPEPEHVPEKIVFKPLPSDVSGLSRIIASAEHKNHLTRINDERTEDEDDVNMLLKDIL